MPSHGISALRNGIGAPERREQTNMRRVTRVVAAVFLCVWVYGPLQSAQSAAAGRSGTKSSAARRAELKDLENAAAEFATSAVAQELTNSGHFHDILASMLTVAQLRSPSGFDHEQRLESAGFKVEVGTTAVCNSETGAEVFARSINCRHDSGISVHVLVYLEQHTSKLSLTRILLDSLGTYPVAATAAIKCQCDYVYFDVGKTANPQVIVDVAILLRTAAKASNFYSIDIQTGGTVLQRAQRIGDIIQFYTSQAKRPYQLLITEVGDDYILGYLAVPQHSHR